MPEWLQDISIWLKYIYRSKLYNLFQDNFWRNLLSRNFISTNKLTIKNFFTITITIMITLFHWIMTNPFSIIAFKFFLKRIRCTRGRSDMHWNSEGRNPYLPSFQYLKMYENSIEKKVTTRVFTWESKVLGTRFFQVSTGKQYLWVLVLHFQ